MSGTPDVGGKSVNTPRGGAPRGDHPPRGRGKRVSLPPRTTKMFRKNPQTRRLGEKEKVLVSQKNHQSKEVGKNPPEGEKKKIPRSPGKKKCEREKPPWEKPRGESCAV